jgi:hypothetical protein
MFAFQVDGLRQELSFMNKGCRGVNSLEIQLSAASGLAGPLKSAVPIAQCVTHRSACAKSDNKAVHCLRSSTGSLSRTRVAR